MTPEKAFELMRNPMKLTHKQRLECHEVILRQFRPIDKSQHMAEALADVCLGIRLLIASAAQ